MSDGGRISGQAIDYIFANSLTIWSQSSCQPRSTLARGERVYIGGTLWDESKGYCGDMQGGSMVADRITPLVSSIRKACDF